MYYTGINPLDMKKVYAPDDYREKLMQRALLQYKRPENRNLVREALIKAGREDLIGFGPECLVKPDMRVGAQNSVPKAPKKNVPSGVKSDKKGKNEAKKDVRNKNISNSKSKKSSTPPRKNTKKGKFAKK